MNKKIILTIIILILLIGAGFMFASKSAEAPSEKAVTGGVNSALVTLEEQYDFGTIDINGGKVVVEFPLTNTGDQAVIVEDGTTSCACTTAELDGVLFDMHKGMARTVTIEPGETKTIIVTYDPLFHGPMGIGKITREIRLKTNSVVTPEIRARFKANVIKE